MKEWGDPLFCLYYEVKVLAAKKRAGNTVEIVRKLAQPIAEKLGLMIWDVRFLKEGAQWYLRIFIDKPEGIGIEDCEAMSRAINAPLDEADPIEQSYCLEVCSPGIDRELVRPEHFAAFIGSKLLVKLIRPLEDGRRELTGILTGYSDDQVISLQIDGGENNSIAKKDTSSVRLVEDEDFVEVLGNE
jgi:ribosome maturation factor RimP